MEEGRTDLVRRVSDLEKIWLFYCFGAAMHCPDECPAGQLSCPSCIQSICYEAWLLGAELPTVAYLSFTLHSPWLFSRTAAPFPYNYHHSRRHTSFFCFLSIPSFAFNLSISCYLSPLWFLFSVVFLFSLPQDLLSKLRFSSYICFSSVPVI